MEHIEATEAATAVSQRGHGWAEYWVCVVNGALTLSCEVKFFLNHSVSTSHQVPVDAEPVYCCKNLDSRGLSRVGRLALQQGVPALP